MSTQTPITDALSTSANALGPTGQLAWRELARKLERDRAALIAALAYMVDAADAADAREDLPECFDRDAVASARATLAAVQS